MSKPPLPPDEAARLRDLKEYEILDTPSEQEFDDATLLASRICDAPVSLISLIDAGRQWFKSKVGTDLVETPRDLAFCAHAILAQDLVVVPDALEDARFNDNPLVTGAPYIRFYAGAPLISPRGHALGTLCVLDTVPRALSQAQGEALQALARQVVGQMALRQNVANLRRSLVERQRVEERLRHDSLHDALTGLPNRVLLRDRVEHCIARAAREPDFCFAVLFIDLDRFKLVNDSLGHAAGDELLRTVARRLEGCLRSTDMACPPQGGWPGMVARLGGDEFTVLLDGLRRPEDAARVAERILQAVSKPIACAGAEVTTTPSIGIVAAGRDRAPYASAKELLRDADAAMYRAKGLGKARYALFDASLHEAAVRRLQLENRLRGAIERGELVLHYQPIVSMRTRQLVGFEALVRWIVDGKLISPAEFIPVAEETSFILPLGRWVLSEACRQMAAWKLARPAEPRLAVSINLSRKQLADPELNAHLRQPISQTGLDPADITLEITESVIMDDGDAALRVLAELRGVGVKLSMDDFGTGYSSLSCLHRIPLDELKIDRSFVQHMSARRDSAAVVQAIINLARNLDMQVVAEGLETTEQVAFLQAMECDLGQGYYFSKPLDVQAATEFLDANRKQMAAA